MRFAMKGFAHAKRNASAELIFNQFNLRKLPALRGKYLLGGLNYLYRTAVGFGVCLSVSPYVRQFCNSRFIYFCPALLNKSD